MNNMRKNGGTPREAGELLYKISSLGFVKTELDRKASCKNMYHFVIVSIILNLLCGNVLYVIRCYLIALVNIYSDVGFLVLVMVVLS